MKELKPKDYLEYERNYFRKFDEYLSKKKKINEQENSGNITEAEAKKQRKDLEESYAGFTDPVHSSDCYCYIDEELKQLYLESGIEISQNFNTLLEEGKAYSNKKVKMKAGLEGVLLGTVTALDDYYYMIQKDDGKVVFDTGCDGIDHIISYKNFVEELRWRGMLQDIIPGTEEHMSSYMTTAYLGVDPTADSLHIGHLCGIMMLRHLQRCGHKPLILIGGATGMIGDPSGKSEERNLLTPATIQHNVDSLKGQLEKFLDFDKSLPNAAEIVNNLDWLGNMTFLDFARNIGKLITVNYMMAKDSVKKRISGDSGISFTEFTYQLLQGYDFCHLRETKNCKLQLGGSDQWGNMTTGIELIRKMTEAEDNFAITCPLLVKSDGTKFGKTERGNIWLSEKYTSPYEFYQFWINQRDEDTERYLKIFTILNQSELQEIIEFSKEHPEQRYGQKILARTLTELVHGKEELSKIESILRILHSKEGIIEFREMSDEVQQNILQFMSGVIPYFEVTINEENDILDILSDFTGIFSSRNEARKAIIGNSVSNWDEKITDYKQLFKTLPDKFGYYLIKIGKKKHYLLKLNK